MRPPVHASWLLIPVVGFLAAPLSAQCVWRVHEMEVGTPFEWTWTQRGSSNEYDGVKRNTKTGKVENILIKLYDQRPDRSVAFGRTDFAGRYRGTIAQNGRTAKGFTDWGGGEWTADISGCGLEAAAAAPVAAPAAQPAPAPAADSGQCTWRVHEMEVGTPFEWTWTRRGTSDEYAGVKRNTKTGKVENIVIKLYDQRPDRSVSFGRTDFAGRYRGAYSIDGRTAKGYTDWGGGEWTAEITGCGLGSAPEKVAAATPALPGMTPGASWRVVEVAGANRWEAVWTIKPDGRSLRATWKHFPGGQEGSAEDFGTIEKVEGDQVVIRRPSLGTYNGTIDKTRGTITGKTSWANSSWNVTLAGGTAKPPELHIDRDEDFAQGRKAAAAPAPKPVATTPKKPEIYVDTAEDLGKLPVFRHLSFGPFGMKAETAWKDGVAGKTMTLTWESDLMKTAPGAKMRFAEQGAAYKSAAERAQLVKKWKTPPPNAPVTVSNGRLGQVAVECVRRDQPKLKATLFECYADSGDTLYLIGVESPGLVKQWPAGAQAVLDTLRWVGSGKKAKKAGPHPIEKAIAQLPKLATPQSDILWAQAAGNFALGAGGPDLGFPANREQRSMTPDQYAAAAQTAMEGFRELAGEMAPEQEEKFRKKWSTFMQEPSREAMTYLDGLVPVMEEFLATRETLANAAVAFDRAWTDAVAAATVDDEDGTATALAVAYQNQQLLLSGQSRLNRILVEAERIGNPPDLKAARERERSQGGSPAKTPAGLTSGAAPVPSSGTELAGVWINDKMTHGLFPYKDGSFGEIECDSPEMGCTIMDWTLKRRAAGDYAPDRGGFTISLMGGVVRWNTSKDWPAYKGDFQRTDLSNPPMPYDPALVERMRKSDLERKNQGAARASAPDDEGGWPCNPANFMCMAEINSRRKYTALAVAKLMANPPANSKEASERAAGLISQQAPTQASAGVPPAAVPRSEKEIREAVAEHQAWIQAIEKSLAKDRADLGKARTAAAQDLLQWRILNAEANVQAERDLIQSLETGVYLHTRTRLDDGLHAQMIDRSREYNANVDQTRRYAAGLMRMANSAATPEQAQQVRDFVSRQLTPADIAAGNLAKAKSAVKAVGNLVQGGNEAAGARAQEKAETADDLLWYAQGTKTVASVALAVLAPAAVAELGFTAATNTVLTLGVQSSYGGVTGYAEGGPVQALRQAASQASLAGAVAVEAFDGYQAGGARGAVQNAAITFVSGKLVEYGASKAAGVYARLRGVPLPAEKLSNITVDEWRTHVQVLNAREDAQRLINLFKGSSGQQRQRLAAEINSNYMAKLIIKQGGAQGAGRPLETDATSTIRELYRTRVDPAFRYSVEQRRIRWQEKGPDGQWRDAAPVEFREFRQGGKRDTFNMDRDFGIVERDPTRFRIARDGQALQLHDAEKELQGLYDQAYRAGMFGQDPRKAFQNVTTSMSGDAYREWGFTRLMNPGQPNIWRNPWAQQAADVAREKVITLDKASMPGALRLIEQARTASKEIEQRLLTQLQRGKVDPAKIDYWRKVQQSLNTMVTDPVTGQRSLRMTSGEDSLRGVIDRVATAIEAANKLGRS